jgi:prepilin-type N-terminal cleavage/methylation domain-containing protein
MYRPRWKRRCAFTLIELLVVIAIIGVLIGLLVPAVQKIREAANRVQCTNNVKQISLAAHTYATSTGKLPGLWYQNYTTRDFVSLFYLLLPYVEQQGVYDQGTSANPTVASGNYRRAAFFVRNNVVKTFTCPSDPTYPDNIDDQGWASSSYAGNVMVFDPAGPGTLTTAMPDGTSNTVVFAHRYKLCDATILFQGGHTQGDWAAYPRDSALGYWSTPGFGYSSYARLIGTSKNQSAGCPSGMASCWAGTSYVDSTTHAPGPWPGWPDFSSSARPTSGIPFQTAPTTGNCNFDVLVSPHPDIMIAGLGDGSVRTVSASIATSTWYYACQPNDGMVLPSDWNQ